MASVCFFYEENDVDVFSGRQDLLDAWNYALLMAGDIDHVVIINLTDERLNFNQSFKVDIVESVENFHEISDGQKVVLVGAENEFSNPVSLWDYDHKDDWYFFGSASGHQLSESGISIPSENEMALHSVHAATVIFSHRYKVMKCR